MSNNANNKKNQHYVPQFYLRNFSNNQKSIGGFFLKNNKYIPNLSINKTACKEYIYGQTMAIENALCKIEQECSIIISNILSTEQLNLTNDEYTLILLFIMISESRTLQIADYNDAQLATLAKILIENSQSKNANSNVHYEIPNLTSMQTSIKLIYLLTDLKLLLIKNETNRGFITSDNPVVRYNQYFVCRNYKRNFGLGQVGAQLFMPLSPKICLCLYDDTMYSTITNNIITIKSGSQINELNKLFVLNAYQYIYFNNHQKEDYIKSVSRYRNSNCTNTTNIPILSSGKNVIIPCSYPSIHEKIKLNFFKINPDLISAPLPTHMAGPLRPITEEYFKAKDQK